MINKLVTIGGIVLLLVVVAGVSAAQENIGTGQNVRAWSTSWIDNGILITESQSIKAIPLCEDNAVMYVYENDIAPANPAVTNRWTTSNILQGMSMTIEQSQTVPPSFHSGNMVIDTENATVQKYCNPVPAPVLH